MNKNIFYIVSVLVALLMTVVSCEKEDVIDPVPETNCTSCPCVEFDGAGINESLSSTTYSPAFYFQGGVAVKGKYNDYSGLGSNLGAAESVLASSVSDPGMIFSGDVLNIKDADVLFDYSNVSHPTTLKSISLKTNDLFATDIKVNGGSPWQYIIYTNNNAVELVGNINSIELGGEDVSIDDLCLNDFIPRNAIEYDSSTINFNDTTFSSIYTAVTPRDINYSPVHQQEVRLLSQQHLPYPGNLDHIDFSIKYTDYAGTNVDGYMHWGTNSYPFNDFHNNFYAGVLELHNCDLEADFSSFSVVNKHVSFDISNDWAITNPNEFEVNGSPLGTLPTGISYHIIPLGNAANGSPCYRVVIEGPINTIVFKGNNTAYDNLYVFGL